MSNIINCPYCNEKQSIDHTDGYGYGENEIHHQECNACFMTFGYETTIVQDFHYEALKIPQLKY